MRIAVTGGNGKLGRVTVEHDYGQVIDAFAESTIGTVGSTLSCTSRQSPPPAC